jgi:hypothetical protein
MSAAAADPGRPTIGRSGPGPAPNGPTKASTRASLGTVTEPPSGGFQDAREGRPPAPPARPRFEFRPPPSAESAPRPSALTTASLLWAGAAVMLLLAVALPLIGVGDLWGDVTNAVNNGFPSEAATTRDRASALVTLVLVGSAVVLALLIGGSAAGLRGGRSGARILLTLLLAVEVVHALLMLGVAPPVSVALLAAGVALGLVAAVLMFLPGTTAWLSRPRRR